MSKRNYYKYYLKKGRKIVYIGITDDLKRREEEHRSVGKDFDKIVKVGYRVTKESAKKWEKKQLEKYRRSHGDYPVYNERKG